MQSADEAHAVIREQTPLAARTVTALGRGTDSVAYLVDGEWVVRFPLVADARETLRRELALLPMLAPALPVAIPAVEHVGRRDGELLFAAYRLLRGEPLGANAQEQALAEVAAMLSALHAFPIADANRAGVGPELLKGGYHEGQRELLGIVRRTVDRAGFARLEDAFRRYERDHLPADQAVVLLHSDLKPDHVLCDGGRLRAVIDWGDVNLGDRDFDLAVFAMFFGAGMLARLLEHVPDRDRAEVLDKTRFFTTLRWTQDLAFDMQRGDRDAAASALRRLNESLRPA
jgi:aminoglycoside phosphotransferase (APT) family kinase protein